MTMQFDVLVYHGSFLVNKFEGFTTREKAEDCVIAIASRPVNDDCVVTIEERSR